MKCKYLKRFNLKTAYDTQDMIHVNVYFVYVKGSIAEVIERKHKK